MNNQHEAHSHIISSTTLKVNAGTKKYHCGFFCQRKIDTDIIDPKDTKEITKFPIQRSESLVK